MPGKVIKYLIISAGLFLAGWVLYLLFNYKQLSEGEGWGVVGMIGILFWGLLFFAVISIVILIIGGLSKKGRSFSPNASVSLFQQSPE
jgi:hypothetical protein